MKKIAIIAGLLSAIVAFSAIAVFALDYEVPEDATTVTAWFFLTDPDNADDEFSMVCADGETVIYITNDTLIYFEDYVPLSDECDGMTQMAREVLFGRTLAEVLDGRTLRVTFDEDEIVSIVILFEIAVPLTNDQPYLNIEPLPEVTFPDFSELPYELNGEIVVNNVMLTGVPAPFLQATETGTMLMLPLRAIAEALDYDVRWNGELRSVQLGAAIHLWIGSNEVHHGRMAPIELSTAPVIVNDLTFVPFDFIRNVLGQTIYVFEAQVVVETYSDMH